MENVFTFVDTIQHFTFAARVSSLRLNPKVFVDEKLFRSWIAYLVAIELCGYQNIQNREHISYSWLGNFISELQ